MLFKLLSKLFKKREESAADPENGDVVKPFLEHLEDLRWTIIKMAAVLVSMMIICFIFAHDIFKALQHPMSAAGLNPMEILRNNSPFAAIMSGIQLSFYAAIVVSLPFLAYILGEFVMPALTKREKRYIIPALMVGFFLFLAGVAFCFYQVLPGMLKFLTDYAAQSGFKDMWDVKTYYAFIAHLCVAFGLLCELPVVIVTLNFIGIVGYKGLAGTRAYALTGILVLCAIVSPSPDLATLFMLALPIMALYECCIWIVWFLDRRREKQAAKLEENPHEPID